MQNIWFLWPIVLFLVLVIFALVWYLMKSARRTSLSDERNRIQGEVITTIFQIAGACQNEGDIMELMTRYADLQEQLENIKKNNQVC
jgi:predicted permease